ncbi:MAG: hypothetical protein LUE29_04305 [Lachnospiraceae bacterium]|nr:hypothetical protein [Lachnospiraceae bacterium]
MNDENLEGIYRIVIHFQPDGKEHLISCRFRPSQPVQRETEPGEWLDCSSYYSMDGKIKLSIGLESDVCYIWNENNELVGDSEYDYDSGNVEENGIYYDSYEILSYTETEYFVFGIAWLTDCREENDTKTWLGADPVGFLNTLE